MLCLINIQNIYFSFAPHLKGVFCASGTEIIPNEPGQVMLPRENDKSIVTIVLTPETKVVFRIFLF
ncbi:hypothetical protein [Psychroflexus aestuariivivens]|uniref:hypothetical protein n=1 Tax=Psychroflexus aestuariivivens TaxID=1795040 RepID=UPI00195F69D7|nr:hypothetical protein [Psychroflexus aestuariivivens]